VNISAQDMRYVCSLAKHLHFGKAAIDVHTSQPNLSVQVKKVESELATKIFERSNKQVLLSDKGTQVVETFKTILATLDSLQRACSESDLITIKMGLFPTLAPYILPKILTILKQSLPNVSFYIVEGKTESIVDKLNSGQLDCIFGASPIDSLTLESDSLFKDEFYLAVAHDNTLSKQKTIRLADLKNEAVLLLEDGHCLRDQAFDICFSESISIDSNYESSSLETLRAMVSVNRGVTFMPSVCLDKNILVKYIPFEPSFSREIRLFWRKSTIQKALFEKISLSIRSQF
jgi:LysR family transcriptional regulator, hydrogen peroxide-inducible genes activator